MVWSASNYGEISTFSPLLEGGSRVLTSTLPDHFTLILKRTVLAILVAWSWWVHPGRVYPVKVFQSAGEAIGGHSTSKIELRCLIASSTASASSRGVTGWIIRM